jgi:AcrR family transcriptional regulator
MRVDARRNVERLLDTAIGVLGEDPTASIEQIAVAAGMHRSTIYRRFPSRDVLVGALLERARDEAAQVVKEAGRLEPSESALRLMFERMMVLGQRYAFLHTHYHLADLGPDPAGFARLIRRYQRADVLRGDISATRLASTLTAIVADLIKNRDDSPGSGPAAAQLLGDLFLDGGSAR